MGAATQRSLGGKLRLVGRLGLIFSLVTCTIAGDAPATNAQNAPIAPTQKVMLERGRVLVLELDTTASSESANEGEHLQLRLVRPVMSGDTVVLPAGWIVTAQITTVRRAGKRNCKDGKISWKIDTGIAADGTKVSLVGLPWVPRSAYGDPPDTVHVKTTGEKVGRGFEWVVYGPIFAASVIVLLPAAIAVASGEAEPCGKQPGTASHVGPILYAAVAKSVRITVNPPATP
jgi:hypothetical protein